MAYISLVLDPSPSGEGYDDSFPTQNNELLAAQIHNTIEDMEDAGWSLEDGVFSTTESNGVAPYIRTNIKAVFDYADSAITQYRSSGTVALTEPAWYDLTWQLNVIHNRFYRDLLIRNAIDCLAMMYKIYYMWQTEEDPLRIKDYIRDMLVAWPLLDTTISLRDEGGSELRIYPSWNEFG